LPAIRDIAISSRLTWFQFVPIPLTKHKRYKLLFLGAFVTSDIVSLMLKDEQHATESSAPAQLPLQEDTKVPYLPKAPLFATIDSNTQKITAARLAMYGIAVGWILDALGFFTESSFVFLYLISLIFPLYGLAKIKDSGDLAWILASAFTILVSAGFSFFIATF
jgi:hypothetical protein